MPTYDYQCQSCSHAFTAMHKMSDAAPACPECGGGVRKLLAAPAIHSRGGSRASEMTPCGMPSPPVGGCGSGMCGHKH